MSISSFVRPAWRSLRRAPAFTITAAMTLVIGIAATVAIFALVNGVLLRPLPYGNPDRLVGALMEGVRLIHDLTKRSPLADAIKRGPRRLSSGAALERYVRNNVSDYGHSVGTCRMGPMPDAGDVVDARGRVHGLANVFVADASILPRIPRANTNLTCSVIGGRVADLLAAGERN